MKEREREMKTIHLIYVSLFFLFFLRVFFKFKKPLATKRSTKTDLERE